MPDVTLEEIQNKFDSLPENLRLAIIVAGADKKVNTIGREHGLNVHQISELLLKTHIVMFGFVHPDKFIEGVKTITGIPPQVVKGIVRDINEQIFKDIREDLIALQEQPKKAEEVESFIEESTPGGTSMTPAELTGPSVTSSEKLLAKSDIVGSPDASTEAFREEKENDEIMKSAGIEIPTIPEKIIETQKPVLGEDKKNDEILKSAGIEIPTISFGNEVGKKLPARQEEVGGEVAEVGKEDVVPPAEEKVEEKEIDTKENAEVMNIAFKDLPKEEIVIPEFKPVEQPPIEEKIEVPSGIYSTVTPEKQTEPIKVTPAIEPTPAVEPTPVVETKSEPVAPVVEIPKQVEEKGPEVPTPQPEMPKIIEPPVEEKKETEVVPEKQTEATQTPEEKKKSADLKLAVKNIIDIYQQKSKASQQEVATYANAEEEKRAIVMQVVGVQDSIKKMKDRLIQLTKEKTKLEKDKKEIASKEGSNSKNLSGINADLGSLAREEKMIQILRESILPKEYLDLLVKLDKLSPHNPPTDAHK